MYSSLIYRSLPSCNVTDAARVGFNWNFKLHTEAIHQHPKP